MEYKSNHNIVYFCQYHVVWCPKYRRKVLTDNVKTRLKELLIESCASMEADIIKMEILPDHVYLLLQVSPRFGIHKAIKRMKAASSSMLRKEFPFLKTKLPTLWTNSYFISTAYDMPPEVIQEYIESQKTSQRK